MSITEIGILIYKGHAARAWQHARAADKGGREMKRGRTAGKGRFAGGRKPGQGVFAGGRPKKADAFDAKLPAIRCETALKDFYEQMAAAAGVKLSDCLRQTLEANMKIGENPTY